MANEEDIENETGDASAPEGSSESASDLPELSEAPRPKMGWSPDVWVALLAMLAATPLVLRYFGRLWGEEHYQYFPLLIGVILWLGWSRWQEAPPAAKPLRRVLAMALGLPALMALALAILFQVPVIAASAAVLGLAVVGLGLASHRKVENLFGLWVLCLLLIRPPWGYDERMMSGLQGLTTIVSSRLLDFVGIFHLTEGNVLTLTDKTFFVDEACSGIISLRTILAATFVIVVYRNRPFIHATLLVLAGLFWAGVMNVIRIGVIVAAYLKFRVDLAEGWQHEVTGIVVFMIAVGGVLSTDIFLTFFLGSTRVGGLHPDNPLTKVWNRLTEFCDFSLKDADFRVAEPPSPERRVLPRFYRWGVGAVLAVLVVLQASVFLPSRSEAESAVVMADLDPAALLDQRTYAPENPAWRVVDFEKKARSARSVWGENSLIWTLQSAEGQRVTFSVDFFFRKWHELTVCYRSSGWQLDERVILPQAEGEVPWQTVEARCHRPASHEQGLMFFDLFRASGEPLEPVRSILEADWKERFSLRNMALFKNALPQGALEVIQMQAFVMTDEKVEGEALEELRAEYEQFRRQVYARLIQGEEGDA